MSDRLVSVRHVTQIRQVPEDIYSFLSASAVVRTADLVLRESSSRDEAHWLLHPGDRFGDYLTWLWREDKRGEICLLLADLIADLRDHNADADPRMTLEGLLEGVRLAVYHLSDDETNALVELARKEVPEYYGGDPDRVG